MKPSWENSDSFSEAGDDGIEEGDDVTVRDGTLSLATDDVLDVRATLLLATTAGDALCPWGSGMARGDWGAAAAISGDILAFAETSGDAPPNAEDLLKVENDHMLLSHIYKCSIQATYTCNFNNKGFNSQIQHHAKH